MREPSPPPHGIRRSYWITVARPGCVTCTVTGRVEASVVGMSAPLDDVVSISVMACARMPRLPPGTEFLDAETGHPKLSPRRVNAHRDQNLRNEWSEIPAETRYSA